ncbi:unnamed protein product [Echinostoma caproni]|uniref:Aamy domain-containing protein n=1 Tax=Echinostoma caproni TaxID=27848 RepID=A0A182ZZD1_9TREM|nr:unnamed protein product [Echinostoma caproni]
MSIHAAMNGDVEGTSEECVKFIPSKKSSKEENGSKVDDLQQLLTREDLMKLDLREPFWRRARLALLIFFWVFWLSLLAAAVLIIVFTPKCPPRPTLEFWQSKVGYWVDPFAFKDSGKDKIGDIRGLLDSLSYIKDTIGAGYIVIGSFLSGQFTNAHSELGLIDDFVNVDPALGTMDDFRSLIRTYHKNGLEVVITLDFNAVSLTHPWVNESLLLKASLPEIAYARDGREAVVSISGKKYYSVSGVNKVDLDMESTEVVHRLLLFRNGSVNFVRSVRKVLDEASQLTTRKRKSSPLQEAWMNVNVASYYKTYAKERPQLGLATASPSDQRQDNILSLAVIFLLPGSPLIYYGSELATELKPSKVAPKELFPMGKVPLPNFSNRDSVLTCHLPMPWSQSGLEFSAGVTNTTFTEYLQSFEIKETVEVCASL